MTNSKIDETKTNLKVAYGTEPKQKRKQLDNKKK